MIPKTWRNTSTKKDWISWWNRERGHGVTVYYQDYIKELKKKPHWTFIVTSHAGTQTILERNTKTKSSALRLAKSYMRGHK